MSSWRKQQSAFLFSQGPGMKDPDVSFNVGPGDAPVKVVLGKQAGLDAGVTDSNTPDSQVLNWL
jgi:hypothetical protein